MLKKGDKLIAKPEFLYMNAISYEEREFTLTKYIPNTNFRIEGTKNGEEHIVEGNSTLEFFTKYFYISTNINYELLHMLDTFAFKEINAVTVDGKVINIR